ncbi:MAG: hypothetical protein IJF76_05200 [Clostridia bacterium]|nr:hypothetical protein [Clostridia bacterium]
MKKFSLMILVVILTLSAFVVGASADTTNTDKYLKITNQNTVLMHSEIPNAEGSLFTIPQNCYVKLLSFAPDANDNYWVEYNGVKGYVSASSLSTPIETVTGVVDPYHQSVLIHSKINGNLKTYPTVTSGNGRAISVNDTLSLIGTFTDSSNRLWLYVCRDAGGSTTADTQDFGCILSTDTTYDASVHQLLPPVYPFGEPVEPEKPLQPGVQDNENQNTTSEPTNNLVRVLLIIGICIPAIIIVALIFKPVRPESARYATENPKRRTQDFDDFDD